jgi:hypothetical protein
MNKKVPFHMGGQWRRWPLLALFVLLLAGCGLQSGPKLDANDMKFAAFYSDYLLRSGTALPESADQNVAMTAGELDSLFARNGFDQKTFDAKLRSYSKDPSLWREVLLQVRKNLRRQQ